MKFRLSKKLLILASTASLSLSGCGESEIVEYQPLVFEDIEETPEVNLTSIDNSFETNEVVLEEEDELIKEDLYVKANTTVNIRKSSSLDSEVINLLGEGASAKLIHEENEFYEVEYLGNDGFVSKDYVDVYNREFVDSEPLKCVYFPNDTVYYDENNNEKGVIPQNELAYCYSDNDYLLVDADGLVGYVPSSSVQDMDGVYAVVDISDQEVKIYDGTDILLDSPVVTGKPSTPTPEGLFQIFEVKRNQRLYSYNRPYINIMMKFVNNVGLHDAEYYTEADGFKHGWRDSSEFGGTTYLTNGSHGCVNMPHDAALSAGEILSNGSKVLVKK